MGVFVGMLLFAVIFALVWLCCIISCMVKPNIDSSTKILWLLILFFLPGLGCILYLLFGPQPAPQAQVVIHQVATPQAHIPTAAASVNETAQVASVAAIPTTTTTYTVESSRQFSGPRAIAGGLVLTGALALIGLIAAPALSRPTTKTFYQEVSYSYSPTNTSHYGHLHPYDKGYVPDKQSSSVITNIATMQEAYYVDTSNYVSCSDATECNKFFGEYFSMSAVPSGYSAEVEVEEFHGEKSFKIKLWNNNRKNTYVEWDSASNGLVR